MDLDLAPRVVHQHSDWHTPVTMLLGKHAFLTRDETTQACKAGFPQTMRQCLQGRIWVTLSRSKLYAYDCGDLSAMFVLPGGRAGPNIAAADTSPPWHRERT